MTKKVIEQNKFCFANLYINKMRHILYFFYDRKLRQQQNVLFYRNVYLKYASRTLINIIIFSENK